MYFDYLIRVLVVTTGRRTNHRSTTAAKTPRQDKTRRGRRKKHRKFWASDGRIFHLPLSFSATAKCVSPTGRGAFLRVLQIRVRGGVKPRGERFPANLRRPDHAPFLLPQMSQLPRSSKSLYGFTVAAFISHFALAVGAIAVHWRTT